MTIEINGIAYAPRCENCGAAHRSQACPEIRAALMTNTLDIDELIAGYDAAHAQIAELRAQLARAHEALGAAKAMLNRVDARVGLADVMRLIDKALS